MCCGPHRRLLKRPQPNTKGWVVVRVELVGEIMRSSWCTIPLKNSHLFKIAESDIFFKQKLIIDSTVLNKWKPFSGMVDK